MGGFPGAGVVAFCIAGEDTAWLSPLHQDTLLCTNTLSSPPIHSTYHSEHLLLDEEANLQVTEYLWE